MESGSLYIVGMPIGNAQDITFRAIQILKNADYIFCEDTRESKKILDRHQIETQTKSFHQHSPETVISEIEMILRSGKDVALISDAGTPNISDPGGKLVANIAKKNLSIFPIPGPSAAITALSISGFPATPFTFLGFPPNKKGRNKFFEALRAINHTIVLYESKYRIIKTVEALEDDRQFFIGRELTKMHESHYRGLQNDVLEQLNQTSTKGEFVIVIAPKNWK